MGGSPFKPEDGIFIRNATTDLQASRPGGKGVDCGLIVSGAEHDHMAAGQVIPAVHPTVIGGGKIRRKIGLEVVGISRTQS